jgi:hypothetical protein
VHSEDDDSLARGCSRGSASGEVPTKGGGKPLAVVGGGGAAGIREATGSSRWACRSPGRSADTIVAGTEPAQ